jgi:hypothetical protein
MILKTKFFWRACFVSYLFLVGCGDDKAPPSQATSEQVPPIVGSAPCVHEPTVSESQKPTKPAPRSPVESYARKVHSGNMKKHLSGVGVPQEKAPLPQPESSDDCKTRVAARYQECLDTAKDNDPASMRRCDIFRQWFRDRCQASGGGAPASATPKAVQPEADRSDKSNP